MSYGESDRPDAASSDVREAAKGRARELRDQHRKSERRRRLTLQLSVLGGVLVIAGIVAVTLMTMGQNTTRGPYNMASDGIVIGEDLVALRTTALKAGADPTTAPTPASDVIAITVYVDYLCANCGTFDEKNSAQLRQWVESGAATLEIRPIAILSSKSAGTQYSLRAANAAACVAEYSPDSFLNFHNALFVDQPEEGKEGLSDAQLIERAEKAGVSNLKKVTSCVESRRFNSWVLAATARALNGPIAGTDVPAVTTVPTIFVDGKQFTYTKDFDPKELALFVTGASGAHNTTETPASTDSATPTPEPSETATP